MRLLRILRGILTTAFTWAVVWAPMSLFPIVLSLASRVELSPRMIGLILLGQAAVGAINGAVFASVLAIVGRRKTFELLTLPQIAACGAVGGVLLPVVVRTVVLANMGLSVPVASLIPMFATNALLGAGLAAASLAIARRAPTLPPAAGSAAWLRPASWLPVRQHH